MRKEEKSILLLIKILCFFIPFSLLLVCPNYFCSFNLFFPYITGKAIYFRILVEIAFAGVLILILKNLNLLPSKREILFWSSVLLVLVMLLLIPFSYRPYLSFWGNAERMEGWWGLLHFFMWFWVLYILFKVEPEFKKTIFYSFLITFYIISLIEIAQKLKGIVRPDSTLGNPTYVGFLSVLMFFLCLYYLKKSSNFEKLLLFIGIIFSISNIFISETRGSILALILAVPLGLIYYFLTSNTKIYIKFLVLLVIFLGILGFYFLISSSYAKNIPLLSRLHDTLKDPRAYMARWLAWGIFLNAWKQNPIVGYGLENSPIAYFKAFNPEIFNYEEVIFDRPHNKYIEILATTGIIGGIVWFLFYLSIIFSIFKFESDRYLKAVLLGLFIGYLGQNLTLFDIQASYLPFLFGLSLISPPISLNEKKKIIERPALNILIIGLTILCIFVNILHFYVVSEIINAINSPYPLGIYKFKNLISLNTNFVPEIANMSARYLESNISKVKSVREANEFTEIFNYALNKDPYDPRLYNILILHLSRLISAKKEAKIDYSEDFNLLNKIYQQYINLYPNYPDTRMDYAKFLQSMGKNEEAIKILEWLRVQYRESPRVIFLLSNLYYTIGEKEKAYSLMDEALKRGLYPENQIQYLIVLRILKDKKTDKFESILKDYLARFSDKESIKALNDILNNK